MTDFSQATWLYEPQLHSVSAHKVEIITEPQTDFWQRSYYGFRNDNAPSLLLESSENFTFITKVEFDYRNLFDQCGVVIYLDAENWFKASIEFENSELSRLGSVVTNDGYSDWATTDVATSDVATTDVAGTDIELPLSIWFRLSRRGPDFLIESSYDGTSFSQMRIFHLHGLGETTMAMGVADPPLPATSAVRFGVYACSPSDSSFKAVFSEMNIGESIWRAHQSK